jgi:hypothetical protein
MLPSPLTFPTPVVGGPLGWGRNMSMDIGLGVGAHAAEKRKGSENLEDGEAKKVKT